MSNYSLDIIIPVFKNKSLTETCLDSLCSNMSEIAAYSPRIILINDSPDDSEVSSFLESYAGNKKHISLLVNEKNLGFVKSVNKGMEIARDDQRAVLLVNSDTKTFPGTLINLLKAADTDSQIGFASPRSNNASLSTMPRLPHNLAGISVSPEQTYRNWKVLSKWMPEISYVPTAVGYYLYIKKEVIVNFGLLNEDFELGYEEENDLILRANKVGYRAVLANHSFAYHSGSASFLLQDVDLEEHKSRNLQKLNLLHPEFLPLVRKYERSPEFIAEGLLKNLLPTRSGKYRMAINLQNMGLHHNGSNELAISLIREISRYFSHKYELTVICSKTVFKYHGLDELANIEHTERIEGNYAIAVNIGQPFDLSHINVIESLAPINIYGMLDVIAEDCGYISLQYDIDRYWRYVSKYANGVFFISKFSEQTCLNRYGGKFGKSIYARILPTKISDYIGRYEGSSLGEQHILVLGNHYKHKDSDLTAKRIAGKLTNCTIVVLGSENITKNNVHSYQSGTISDEQMISLFAKASAVVLPSYYEGFGFGLMHCLALGKPVVARDIPATREILSTFRKTDGVFLYYDNDEVVDLVCKAIEAGASKVEDDLAQTWNDWAAGFVDFCDQLISSPDVFSLCAERIREGGHLREFHLLKNLLGKQETIENPAASSSEMPLSPSQRTSKEMPGMQSEMKYPFENVRTIDDLLALNDDIFVEAAYEKLLLRKGDPDGVNYYLQRIKNGCKKVDVIKDIRKSSEGRAVSVSLPGLNDIVTKKTLKGALSRLFR